MNKWIALTLVSLFFSSDCFAGKLIPPENADITGACRTGWVLNWTGKSVTCADPTANIQFACPAGQVVSKVVNGVPTCTISGAGLGACPPGEIIAGVGTDGSVQCINPISSLATTCPDGKILSGITNNAAICIDTPTVVQPSVSTVGGIVYESAVTSNTHYAVVKPACSGYINGFPKVPKYVRAYTGNSFNPGNPGHYTLSVSYTCIQR